MTRVILSGCNGKMGQAIVRCTQQRNDVVIAAGVDIYTSCGYDFPVFDDFSKVNVDADVVIDFSNPSVLDGLLAYVKKTKLPSVICTTGFNENQVQQIKAAAEYSAVFYSGNMSLGINLMIELSKRAAAILSNDFDIEIIEKHHNQKLDAPSGTALMIADGISSELSKEPQYVYDRHSYRKKRDKNEIGIHSIRGGTIVGEHEVIFAGTDEVVSIKHQATSKEVFAVGAVNAAVYLNGKPCGMYNMSDLISSK
ncbi:MAG: 4-hydroxy-tetrahydrodipicolinate reductase [Acutalibacteraceae bacterium]